MTYFGKFLWQRVLNFLYLDLTDEYKIVGIINNLNPNKAPGVDIIPTLLIKAAKYVLAPYLIKCLIRV